MDRASIGPAPPASERARTPPAAASSAWPEACIREPATMATPSEGCARTARPVRAYKDGDLTQMCVHLVPAGTQIAKFQGVAASPAGPRAGSRSKFPSGFPTQTPGTRYSDRPASLGASRGASPRPRTPHSDPRAATPTLQGSDAESASCQTAAAPPNPLAPHSLEERLRPWPAARPRKPTRVRLP